MLILSMILPHDSPSAILFSSCFALFRTLPLSRVCSASHCLSVCAWLSGVEQLLEEQCNGVTQETDAEKASEPKLALLQSLLSVSHKYQLIRLQLSCETKLCKLITAASVCSIVSQAHLLESSALELACMDFICEHLESVMVRHEYGLLGKEWPAVMLKVQLHKQGVGKDRALAAFKAHSAIDDEGKKRQRVE